MGRPLFGCQTYSWQMSKEIYAGKMEHITNIIGKSGMAGVEAEVVMMGSAYDGEPREFKELLDGRGLTLAALALPLWWREPDETDEERRQADKAIAFLSHFPEAVLNLCHLPGDNRHDLLENQKNQWRCISEVAKRAAYRGISVTFHPNSSPGSLFRTWSDYQWLFEKFSSSTELFYCPDAGHIAHGGMDPLEIFRISLPFIRHVHFKDMDDSHEWQPMGKGCIDFQGIVELMVENNYGGWFMVEEESWRARQDPDAVTLENGRYIRERLLNCTEGTCEKED